MASPVSNQNPSKIEIVVNTASQVTGRILATQSMPFVEKAVVAVGQTCQQHPSLIVAGAVGTIAVKEYGSHVAPYLKPVVEPIGSFAQKYPKITLLTTSTVCSTLLPYAATGEPFTVTATGISCAAAAAAFVAYILTEKK
jgi:hypothetical protein